MTKPPAATPHSDIDGIHEDEAPNTDTANAVGETAEDLARAKSESKGRPDQAGDASRDDRTR